MTAARREFALTAARRWLLLAIPLAVFGCSLLMLTINSEHSYSLILGIGYSAVFGLAAVGAALTIWRMPYLSGYLGAGFLLASLGFLSSVMMLHRLTDGGQRRLIGAGALVAGMLCLVACSLTGGVRRSGSDGVGSDYDGPAGGRS